MDRAVYAAFELCMAVTRVRHELFIVAEAVSLGLKHLQSTGVRVQVVSSPHCWLLR